MIANVSLTKRGAPIFYGEVDLRLLIKVVKREGICNYLHSAGAFRLASLFFTPKILVVFFITVYAFGVALATVTVLLCGRFVVLSRKNWLQAMLERSIAFKSKAPRLSTC